jgi:hypothetical protein
MRMRDAVELDNDLRGRKHCVAAGLIRVWYCRGAQAWPCEPFDTEKWAACLTAVRLATLFLKRDDQEFEKVFSEIVAKSDAPDVLDAWCTAQEDLRDMIELLDTVLKKSFSVLERLGYSPDNLPPGRSGRAMHR